MAVRRFSPGPRLFLTYATIVAAIAALALLIFKDAWVGGAALNDSRAAPRAVTARGELFSGEKSTIALFRQASPAVVNITAIGVQRDLFTLNLYQIPQGTGSGFVWDTRGNIITNFHVIQNADTAQVTLADQSNWKARVVGVAPDKDLAVLRIDAPANRLPPIPLGTSKDLQVGQSVFAIGNPFGLDQTLTTGVISALNREIESVTRRPIQGVIQSDAAINPGNSGGPLLDSAGRLIGVNTAIYSPSGASAGIGFAIPVDTVNRIVPELIRSGKVTRPGLGVKSPTSRSRSDSACPACWLSTSPREARRPEPEFSPLGATPKDDCAWETSSLPSTARKLPRLTICFCCWKNTRSAMPSRSRCCGTGRPFRRRLPSRR